MERPGILILTRSDIARLMNLQDYMAAVENAFMLLAAGRIPGAGVLDLPGAGGMFHIKGSGMPDGEELYIAVKVNGNFPGNKQRFGLPTIQGAILLCDGVRGYPLALLDSIEVTINRTGAASAIAARYLARENSETLTICGCGEQGRVHAFAMMQVLPLKRVFAYDQDRGLCEGFCAGMSQETGIPFVPVSRLEEGTLQSDVIVTCTTSRKHFLKKEHVPEGAFIAAVGADSHDKQEIDPALMASCKVVADIADQCARIGDLHHAIAARLMTREDVYAELHEVLSRSKPGRTSQQEIIVFDSTGTAIQDVAAAAIAYQRAIKNDVGQFLDLLGS